MLELNDVTLALITMFFTAVFGYVLGSVNIKGVRLGSSAIFIIGLVFGHFGHTLPAVVQTLGIALFGVSVGLSSGGGFLQRIKKNGIKYALLCIITVGCGALVCVFAVRVIKLDTPLAVGIMTGAFTTSPGFAAAKEAADAAASPRVAAGYGLAYPIGLIVKVLMIQVIPLVLKANMAKEKQLIALPKTGDTAAKKSVKRLDRLGMMNFAIAAAVGLLLGSVHIPLPGGAKFSLGTAGGTLLAGLALGQLGNVGKLDLTADKDMLNALKEFGLLLFFASAGMEGGQGIARIVAQYGALPLLFAFFYACFPFVMGFFAFRFILRLPLLNGLSAMAAGMACTPSLAVLIDLSGTDDVSAAYATTYPIAVIVLVLCMQFLMLL